MKTDEEYEEELDPHSSKFRAEGQLMAYEEEPSFEGYLSVKVNKHVLKEGRTLCIFFGKGCHSDEGGGGWWNHQNADSCECVGLLFELLHG